MRKLRIENGQFIIIISLLLTFSIFHFPFSISTAKAVESTPSADIKSKLEALKKEIASKAAKLKSEINIKLQNKAYIGSIKTKSANSLTLASSSGPKIVNINQDTVYGSNIKSKKYSAKALSEEDYTVSLGDIDDTGVLNAKKIILLPKPNTKEKNIIWGQVISLSNKKDEASFLLRNKSQKNLTVTIQNTDFKKGEEEIIFDDIKLNDFVIVVGFPDQTEVLQSEFIYVIPQGGYLKPKKIATPSAEPSKPSQVKSSTTSAKKR